MMTFGTKPDQSTLFGLRFSDDGSYQSATAPTFSGAVHLWEEPDFVCETVEQNTNDDTSSVT